MGVSASERQKARRQRLRVAGGKQILVSLSPEAAKALESLMDAEKSTLSECVNLALIGHGAAVGDNKDSKQARKNAKEREKETRQALKAENEERRLRLLKEERLKREAEDRTAAAWANPKPLVQSEDGSWVTSHEGGGCG